MAQLGEEVRLAHEAFDEDRILLEEHFERDRPKQLDLDRLVDDRHPAATELALDVVVGRQLFAHGVEQAVELRIFAGAEHYGLAPRSWQVSVPGWKGWRP